MRQQALLHEHLQRGAERVAPDAEAGRQFNLAELRAGRELAAQDELAQGALQRFDGGNTTDLDRAGG
jgi:hypothetical protein